MLQTNLHLPPRLSTEHDSDACTHAGACEWRLGKHGLCLQAPGEKEEFKKVLRWRPLKVNVSKNLILQLEQGHSGDVFECTWMFLQSYTCWSL